MRLEDRMLSLESKHARLEERIHAETKRPIPDPVELHALKRAKLRVKDELERLRHMLDGGAPSFCR